MDFLIPSSIVAVFISFGVVIFVMTQLLIDGSNIARTRKLYRHFVEAGKQSAAQNITIIVRLSKKAESIIPLLDHLLAVDDKKLKIIVVTKHTAGKKAKTTLALYRRKNKMKNLHIIRYQKGMRNQDISKKYTNGHIYIELLPESRLARGFCEALSDEFLLSNSMAVVPKQVHHLNNTLASAFASHSSTWNSLSSLFRQSSVVHRNTPLVAFHADAEHNASETVVAKIAHNATILLPALNHTSASFRHAITKTVDQLSMMKIIVITSFTTGAFIALKAFPTVNDIVLGIIVILGLLTLLYAINMSYVKGYSVADRIALVLLTPFIFIYSIVIWTTAICIYVVNRFSRYTAAIVRGTITKVRLSQR